MYWLTRGALLGHAAVRAQLLETDCRLSVSQTCAGCARMLHTKPVEKLYGGVWPACVMPASWMMSCQTDSLSWTRQGEAVPSRDKKLLLYVYRLCGCQGEDIGHADHCCFVDGRQWTAQRWESAGIVLLVGLLWSLPARLIQHPPFPAAILLSSRTERQSR